MASRQNSSYQFIDSSLNLDSPFRLTHSLSMIDLSSQLISSSAEEREIINRGRSAFLRPGVDPNAPFTNDTLDRIALSQYKKSSIKNACKYLGLHTTEVDKLFEMQTREKRRVYTGRFRSKQSSVVDQLSGDIGYLLNLRKQLLNEKYSLTQEIEQYKQPIN